MPTDNIKPSRFQLGLIRRIGVDKYIADVERGKLTTVSAMGSTDEKHKMLERAVWYKGDAHSLEWFYKTHHTHHIYPSFSFWRAVNTDLPRVHYPMASMISDAFSSILFSNKPEFVIDSGSKSRDVQYKQRLDDIFSVNEILSLLQEAAAIQSYSGGVGLKINIDYTLSDVPLITIYPQEKYYCHKKYGQIVYIDFFDDYGTYTLRSRYGRGYISYALLQEERVVPLTSIPETADLKDIAFTDTESNLIPFLFATEVPNRGNGGSDYDGLTTSFHALDEAYSAMTNYIRKTKPNLYVTEDLIPKDVYGKPLKFNDFDAIITMLDSTPDGQGTSIQREIEVVNVAGYRETFDTIRNVILQKAGISPSTLGIETAGANASGEALNIRERASARTRTEKLSVWGERLEDFIYSLLIMDKIARNEVSQEGMILVEEIPEFIVKVDFGSLHEKSLSEKIDVYKEALAANMISMHQAVYSVFKDIYSEDEIKQMVIDIKLEKGLILTPIEAEFANINTIEEKV